MFAYMFLDLFMLIHLTQETNLPVYLGCFEDFSIFSSNKRILQEELYEDDRNTRDRCIQECFNAGYNFSGTEDGDECWCGDTLTSNNKVPDHECNNPCSGNASQSCGGSWRLSLYNISLLTTTTSSSSTTTTTTKTTRQTTVEKSSPYSVNQSTSVHESGNKSAVTNTSSSSSASLINVTTVDPSLYNDTNKGAKTGSSTVIYISVSAAALAAAVAILVFVLWKRRKKQKDLVPEVIYSAADPTEPLNENPSVQDNIYQQEEQRPPGEQDMEGSEYNVLHATATNVAEPENTYDHMAQQNRVVVDNTYSHMPENQSENTFSDTYSHIA